MKVWVGCKVPHTPGIITHSDACCLLRGGLWWSICASDHAVYKQGQGHYPCCVSRHCSLMEIACRETICEWSSYSCNANDTNFGWYWKALYEVTHMIDMHFYQKCDYRLKYHRTSIICQFLSFSNSTSKQEHYSLTKLLTMDGCMCRAMRRVKQEKFFVLLLKYKDVN